MERGQKLFDLVLACVLILRLLLVLLLIRLAVGVSVVGVRLDVGRRRLGRVRLHVCVHNNLVRWLQEVVLHVVVQYGEVLSRGRTCSGGWAVTGLSRVGRDGEEVGACATRPSSRAALMIVFKALHRQEAPTCGCVLVAHHMIIWIFDVFRPA